MKGEKSRQRPGTAPVAPEKIAYWFFRLNGCFTWENFIVHPEVSGGQRTDADLIALRFRDRREMLTSGHPMQDHALFEKQKARLSVFFVEVKAGRCALNGPWTKPERQNLQRVLHALGAVPQASVEQVANDLYRDLRAQQDDLHLQFFAVGRKTSPKLRGHGVPQLSWRDVLLWIHGRFNTYCEQKADHSQWEPTGQQLFHAACRKKGLREDPNAFVEHWLRRMGVTQDDAGNTR